MTSKNLAPLSLILLATACGATGADDGAGSTTTAAAGTGGSTAVSTSATDGASTSADGATSSSAQGGATTTAGSGGGGPGTGAAALPARAAKAVCGALFRCCDSGSQAAFFEPLVADTRLAAFVGKLPPKAQFASEAACATALTEAFAVAPFGDWVAAVESKAVGYDEAAVESCAKTLATAACGAPVTSALLDGTCFGYAAPAGGSEQRSMFVRSAAPGATCTPLRDGVGATFYGTCDPTKAFCCYEDPAKPGVCALPFDAQGKARTGACKAASAVGSACDLLKNVQLCKTGDACDTTTGKCVASKEAPLALGATCLDKSYNLLGNCVASYCDVLGTKKCEALKPDGAKCNGYDQCASNACEAGSCAPSKFCKG